MTRPPRTDLARAFALLACCALAACSSSSLGYRDPVVDPDQRLAAAIEEFEAVERGERDPNRRQVLIDPERPRREIERLAFEFPRHVPTRMANAVLAWRSRDALKATRHLDALFELVASHPEAAILRAEVALAEGNVPFAKRLLERQVLLAPAHAGLREALSAVHYATSDWQAALDELALAERLGAPEWRVAYHRGLVAEGAGDLHQAWLHYAHAVYVREDFSPAANRLAGTRARLGLPPLGPMGRRIPPEEG